MTKALSLLFTVHHEQERCALDLFSWGGRLRCIRALMVDLSARKGAAFDAVDVVRH